MSLSGFTSSVCIVSVAAASSKSLRASCVLTEAVQVYLLVTLFYVIVPDDVWERGVSPLVRVHVDRASDVQPLELAPFLPPVPDSREYPAAMRWVSGSRGAHR
eukprot:6742347-Pyramimonas_sp.AAC.1